MTTLERTGTADAVARGRDVVGSVLGVVALAPVWAAIALAIRRDSPGPVFFRQERVGREGTTFRIHKFRTMADGVAGPGVAATGDGRVTRVGRFLRATKLDETPQLLDVLAGDMSLVGPRPELPEYVARWPADLRPLILSVRPGITDPASVALCDESELLAASADPERAYVDEVLPLKARAYADYVATRSLWGDLRILLDTVRAVLGHPAPDTAALARAQVGRASHHPAEQEAQR